MFTLQGVARANTQNTTNHRSCADVYLVRGGIRVPRIRVIHEHLGAVVRGLVGGQGLHALVLRPAPYAPCCLQHGVLRAPWQRQGIHNNDNRSERRKGKPSFPLLLNSIVGIHNNDNRSKKKGKSSFPLFLGNIVGIHNNDNRSKDRDD